MESKNKKLLNAAGNGDINSVKECLADGADVNCIDDNGLTPLHWAAQNGHKDTVFLLISKYAAIHSKDKNGLTPLHCAAGGYGYKGPLIGSMKRGTQRDHITIVDHLIFMRAVIDSKDGSGRKPIDLASFDEMKKHLKEAQEGLDAGVPIELLHLDKKSVDNFKHLLKEDSYALFELRAMLQGEQGTGKSTIARFLVGKRPTLFRMSTDGIDLYTGLSFFDSKDDWLDGEQDFTLEDIIVSRTFQELKNLDLSEQQELAPESSRETEQNETVPIQLDNPLENTNADTQIEQIPQPTDPKIIRTPSIIERLKAFFGVNKEIEEIKVSVTKEIFYEDSRKVAKKKFHKRKIVPVTIWDFGGQDVFYSTHQTFLTYRAVYMIILDGSRTLDEPCKYERFLPAKDGAAKTQRDYLRFWVNTIITYCKGGKPGFPKIMVILTHKDKLEEAEIENRRDDIFGQINEMFNDSLIKQHLVINDRIFVNARNNNDLEMEKIKKCLIKQAKDQPTWGEKLPKCFLPLELEIQSLVRKDIAVIGIDEIKKIKHDCVGMPTQKSPKSPWIVFHSNQYIKIPLEIKFR